jgi:hypothetical protein
MSLLAVVVGPGALPLGRVLRWEGYRVLVLLPGVKSVVRLRRKYPGLLLVKGAPGAPPIAPGCADLLVLAGGFPDAKPWDLARLARVLRPGGALVALSPDPNAAYAQVMRAPGRLLSGQKARIPTPEQLTQALLLAGLANITQAEFGTWMPLLVTMGYATRASAALGALAG